MLKTIMIFIVVLIGTFMVYSWITDKKEATKEEDNTAENTPGAAAKKSPRSAKTKAETTKNKQ